MDSLEGGWPKDVEKINKRQMILNNVRLPENEDSAQLYAKSLI